MSVEALISTQVIDTTSVGRSVMTAADAAAVRTAADAQVTLVSGTNIKTVNGSTLLGSGDLTISGLSGTGSVDNAALRADGTGGATLQSSAWIINDNLTASPNNTVNHACLEATGGTTNVSVSIKPKGTGAFSLSPPDSASTGGNVRGANAVDLQTARAAATQVASANFSVISGGNNNTSSGLYAVVSGGNANAATGGNSPTVTGGNNNTASADFSRAGGFYALADQYGMDVWSGGGFANFGSSADFRRYIHLAKQKTTNTTPTRLQTNGINQTATFTYVPSGSVVFALIRILGAKSDGSAIAAYVRKVVLKNVAGTTSIVGSVETIGTDIEDSPGVTDLAITADNTNDAINITVTAEATWRWAAFVDAIDILYGT